MRNIVLHFKMFWYNKNVVNIKNVKCLKMLKKSQNIKTTISYMYNVYQIIILTFSELFKYLRLFIFDSN